MALLNQVSMIKKIGLVIILINSLLSFGQQESYYSLYRYNMNVINPAFAGAEAPSMLTLTSRSQWVSVEGAPTTFALAYSSARKNNVGLGLSLVSDKVFVEQQTFAYVDFSYKLQVSDVNLIYLGLKAGGNFYNSDPTELSTYDPYGDPSQIGLSKFNPNIGAGVYFKGSNYWASFSIPRLFNVKRNKDLAITAKDRVHAYLGGGANFELSSNIILKPSLMVRKVKGLPTTADITAMASWQNQFDLGISLRTNSSIALLSFISLGNFDVGYAYETPTENLLSQVNLKTHEIVLRIKLGGDSEETPQETESTPEE